MPTPPPIVEKFICFIPIWKKTSINDCFVKVTTTSDVTGTHIDSTVPVDSNIKVLQQPGMIEQIQDFQATSRISLLPDIS